MHWPGAISGVAIFCRSGNSARGLFNQFILPCCSASALAVISAILSILARADRSVSKRKQAEVAAKQKADTATIRNVRRYFRSLLDNVHIGAPHDQVPKLSVSRQRPGNFHDVG